MLPAPARMRRGEDFSLAVRRGRRAGSTHLAVHLATVDRLDEPSALRGTGTTPAAGPRRHPSSTGLHVVEPVAPRVGFVVSKAVGNAVTRTRVKRRLRALAASRLHRLPAGSLTVLRATPASAQASSAVLASDLDRVLDRVLRPVAARP